MLISRIISFIINLNNLIFSNSTLNKDKFSIILLIFERQISITSRVSRNKRFREDEKNITLLTNRLKKSRVFNFFSIINSNDNILSNVNFKTIEISSSRRNLTITRETFAKKIIYFHSIESQQNSYIMSEQINAIT